MPDLEVGQNRPTLVNIRNAWDSAQGGSADRRPSNPAGRAAEGSSTHSGDGVATAFTVTHNAGFTPSRVELTPTTAAAAAAHYISAKTTTTFVITFAAAPANAANNVKFEWVAYK